MIKAQDTAAAQAAAHQSQAAAAAAERGRLQIGRKPKDPHAALARAEVEHAVALKRVEDLKAERERRDAAAARGENAAGPRLRIDKAQRTLQSAEQRLLAARTALQTAPATARQVNVTDPDSRIMTTKDGWVQGYNAQAIVNPHQIVLACDVSQDASDVQLYEPMNQTLTRTLTTAGITAEIGLQLADAGYCSEHNLTCPGPDRLIATTKDHKQRRAARELGHTNGPPPPDATPVEEMEHLLRTPQGARRLQTALPTDRTRLRRPQTQPPDPQLPPPRPRCSPQRMGVHQPRRQPAQTPPAPQRRRDRLTSQPSTPLHRRTPAESFGTEGCPREDVARRPPTTDAPAPTDPAPPRPSNHTPHPSSPSTPNVLRQPLNSQ